MLEVAVGIEMGTSVEGANIPFSMIQQPWLYFVRMRQIHYLDIE